METLKQKVKNYYSQLVQDQIDVFSDLIVGLTEDAKNDAKSSAGDKHETALSMMQLEQEKLNQKIAEYQNKKSILNAIDASKSHQKVGLGTLIITNHMVLFVSVAMPKIKIEDKTVFGVSSDSPLVKKMYGQEVGFEFEINGTNYKIESIS